MKTLVLLLLFVLTLSGCSTTPSKEAESIAESTQGKIVNCPLVGEVEGHSSVGGLFMQETGLKRAQNEARENATKLRSTDLIWTKLEKGFWGAHAQGNIYMCPKR